MDRTDRLGPGDREQIVAALQIARVTGQLSSAEGSLVELELLDHGARGPIEDQDPPMGQILQSLCGFQTGFVGHIAVSVVNSSKQKSCVR